MRKEVPFAPAAPESGGAASPRPANGSSERAKRRRLAFLAAAVAVSGAAAWKLKSSSGYFPRRESQFLSSSALDRRLEKDARKLKDNPDDLRALVDSGVLMFQKGKDFYPDAVNQLHDAWKSGALDVRIFYYTGVMYQELALYPSAIEQYQKFLRNRPGDDEVRLLLAKLLYQSGRKEDVEEAASQYQQLSRRLARNPLVCENLALSLKSMKKYDEAKAELGRLASAFGPAEARRAHYYLGQIASEQNDPHEAMRQFVQILPLDGGPDIGIPPLAVYTAVAENYDKLKAPATAKEAWDKVAELDPKNRKAQTRLSALKKQLAKKKPAKTRKR